MPATGELTGDDPCDPKNPASPKGKTPPSAAVSRYPAGVDGAGAWTVGGGATGAAEMESERERVADGPPLLLTVWPVKIWVVDVPAESVTVRVAVNDPELA
jgi:hypothetical protein